MDCHRCHQSRACGQRSPHRRGRRWWARWQREVSPREAIARVALVGMPNVGKSVLFNALTGTYATVSNYPGTTVEVSQGTMTWGDRGIWIVDTPGLYSLVPITDEERVARDLLLADPARPTDLAIHVVDAKNLGRMLPLTFQLLEIGLPVMLAVNAIDEAQQLGLDLRADWLERQLGIPVVAVAAALGWGVRDLKAKVAHRVGLFDRPPTPLSRTH